jgi:hypothetical protein
LFIRFPPIVNKHSFNENTSGWTVARNHYDAIIFIPKKLNIKVYGICIYAPIDLKRHNFEIGYKYEITDGQN